MVKRIDLEQFKLEIYIDYYLQYNISIGVFLDRKTENILNDLALGCFLKNILDTTAEDEYLTLEEFLNNKK